MADDLKTLGKKLDALEKSVADISKRLKFNEDRIKVLADSLTSEKDIEKLLDVHYNKLSKEQTDNMKANTRRMELTDKLNEARDKEYDKLRAQDMEMARKEAEKYTNQALRDIEKLKIETRLTVLESKVASLGR